MDKGLAGRFGGDDLLVVPTLSQEKGSDDRTGCADHHAEGPCQRACGAERGALRELGETTFRRPWAPKGGLAQLSERAAFGAAGALAGTLGVVIGATGPIIAPFLLREGWDNEEIIATKATGQAFIHG